MPFTENLRRCIIQGGSALEIRDIALEEGMLTLRRVALLNAMRGKTSVEEVLRSSRDD
jgi:type IV pilus assembly protein PilB